MRKKIFTTLLTAVTLFTSLPMNIFAANTTFEPENGDKVTVVASAIVTETELSELGLDLVISIPTDIPLSMEGNSFKGTGEIYAYGVMDNDKVLCINIDQTHNDYLKVYFHETPGDNSATLSSDTNFNGTVKAFLNSTYFTYENTAKNYLNIQNGEDFTYKSVLSVEIKNLLPYFGAGEYFTRVPLIIELNNRA